MELMEFVSGQATSGAATMAAYAELGTAYAHQYCFAAGTPVVMADGSSKPIEQVRPGELVLAAADSNPEGPVEAKPVVEVYNNDPNNLLEIHAGGQVIRGTPNHPFYVREKGWTHAEQLAPGDQLRTHDGGWVAVEEKVDTGQVEAVYNLQVADCHTYFVGRIDSAPTILVHNESPLPTNVTEVIKDITDVGEVVRHLTEPENLVKIVKEGKFRSSRGITYFGDFKTRHTGIRAKDLAKKTGQLIADIDVSGAVPITREKFRDLGKQATEMIRKEFPHLNETSSKFAGLVTDRKYELLDDFIMGSKGEVFKRYTKGGYHYAVKNSAQHRIRVLVVEGSEEAAELFGKRVAMSLGRKGAVRGAATLGASALRWGGAVAKKVALPLAVADAVLSLENSAQAGEWNWQTMPASSSVRIGLGTQTTQERWESWTTYHKTFGFIPTAIAADFRAHGIKQYTVPAPEARFSTTAGEARRYDGMVIDVGEPYKDGPNLCRDVTVLKVH